MTTPLASGCGLLTEILTTKNRWTSSQAGSMNELSTFYWL